MLPILSANCVPEVDTLAILVITCPVNASSISHVVVLVVFGASRVTPEVLQMYEKPPCWLGLSMFKVDAIEGIDGVPLRLV